ncbi:NfeD family protein [Microbacterium betulae]|uniref:NfeD family protein n=1 Tax=Microbacterium betulae TaxID=2981139 RepID=A0AA97FEC7_9MICO|nr:NfeD family protein [Microbacterium sp. AB]WOF21475.1 NfeD family protein [Microbacterium sp. AB]
METIDQFAWIGWLAVIAIFLVVELVSGELTFLMLGFGGVFGLASGAVGAPLWLQVIVAAAAAALLLLFVRPPLLRRLRRSADPKAFNVDALIGLAGVVTETVTPLAGRVKLVNGDSWSARIREDRSLAPQTPVTVESIEGATAVVAPRTSEEN